MDLVERGEAWSREHPRRGAALAGVVISVPWFVFMVMTRPDSLGLPVAAAISAAVLLVGALLFEVAKWLWLRRRRPTSPSS